MIASLFMVVLAADLKLLNEVEAYVQNRVAFGYEPAIAVAYITPEADSFFTAGTFGEGSRNVDPQTLFEIGSISKAFTAILFAQAATRGLVDLDDPIDKYLPEGVRGPNFKGKSITLRHLANHTSSLPRLPFNLQPKNPSNPYKDYTYQQLYDFLSKVVLSRKIGSQYEYSNVGAGLLGHLLELKTGKTYEELVQDWIANPLGMPSTVIRFQQQQKPMIAAGHDLDGKVVSHWDIPTLAGAGGLRSNLDDMVTFLKANMGLLNTTLTPAMTLTHQSSHSINSDLDIGLGWHLLKANGATITWHNGGTGGFRTFCGFDKARKVGVVVLTNSTFGADAIGWHLLNPKEPLPKIHQAIPFEPEMATLFCGTYKGAKPQLVIHSNGKGLTAQRKGRARINIYPMGKDRFFAKVADLQIQFKTNDAGAVTGARFITPSGETVYRSQRPSKK